MIATLNGTNIADTALQPFSSYPCDHGGSGSASPKGNWYYYYTSMSTPTHSRARLAAFSEEGCGVRRLCCFLDTQRHFAMFAHCIASSCQRQLLKPHPSAAIQLYCLLKKNNTNKYKKQLNKLKK